MNNPGWKTVFTLALAIAVGFSAPADAGRHRSDEAAGDMMVKSNSPVVNGFRDAARTVNRLPSGDSLAPQYMFERPEHFAFTPLVSNWDPQNMHSQQWDGQDWDPSRWNQNWTPESTLGKFFQDRVFERQFMRKAKPPVPVLELGPVFYKLSDLDQRRALKLLIEHTGVFQQGFPVIELRDWHTHNIVGTYTPKGMFLN